MIVAVGDLVEDVVAYRATAIEIGSDTPVRIVRRHGGSAANVCVAAVRSGGAARFVGNVGSDHVGDAVCAQLASSGVDVAVRRRGRTGTIVVLVDEAGERSMLTDRGDASDLDDPDPAWLTGASALHVPLYSLVHDPLAATVRQLAVWAHERGVPVSVDASSVSVIDGLGAVEAERRLSCLDPAVLFANAAEAEALGGRRVAALTVVKHGAAPAEIHMGDAPVVSVAAVPIDDARDTTGAGDAFAAGFLVALGAGADPVEAARAGHASAARQIRTMSLD